MSKINVFDFYYGAVLSILFSRHINPALVECTLDRQIYDITTNHTNIRRMIKARTDKMPTKSLGSTSWSFSLTQADIQDMTTYLREGYNLVLVLILADKNLRDSELALIDCEQVQRLLELGKKSICISKAKHEHSYKIAVHHSRMSGIRIPTNRFDELFKKRTAMTIG